MTMTDEERLAVLDRITEMVGELRSEIASVRSDLLDEPTATADAMTVGGWVKMPGSARWRKILGVTACSDSCRRIAFDTHLEDRDGTSVHVHPDTAYPFLTAEQFDRDCDAEREVAA